MFEKIDVLKHMIKPLDNIYKVVHFQSSYTLEPSKFTKTELLYRYFSGILTTDSHGNFTYIFMTFLQMATAISKNTFFPEHLRWLPQQILKIKLSILKSFKKNEEMVEVVQFMV